MLSQEIIALAETENKRTKYLSNLAEILKQDSDDLLTTLGVYMIDCDSKLNLTAQTLFLHRNTVTYRLNKVRQLTNTNFTLMPAAVSYTHLDVYKRQVRILLLFPIRRSIQTISVPFHEHLC